MQIASSTLERLAQMPGADHARFSAAESRDFEGAVGPSARRGMNPQFDPARTSAARHGRRALRSGLLAAAACLLSACVSSVVVESDFPTPLVQPLPVSVGVIFDDDLQNFVHVEDLPQRSAWTIDLGDANIAMLSPLFDTMFAETRRVDDVSSAGRFDGVLRPQLDKFEFDVPIGERDQFVEVWMQYLLTLYAPDGTVVTTWPVTGYGKAELTRRRQDSVRRAAIVAMREVGATISTRFAEQPDVSYWLQERQNEAALSAEVGG